MPLLPADPTPPTRPWYTRGPVIAAVGGVAAALVTLIALLIPLEPGVTVAVMGVVGSLLALWRSGTGNPPATPPTGTVSVLLVLLVMSGAWAGCATANTPIKREAARHIAWATLHSAEGGLLVGAAIAADRGDHEQEMLLVGSQLLIHTAADDIVDAVVAGLSDPVDIDAVADGVVQGAIGVLVDLKQEVAARLLGFTSGIIRTIFREAWAAIDGD
uniref:Uncharacterized protein n=1 Tax=viral metagenome TaxID=1070528 RepID=A0A6M3KQU9_9ZZZZ